MKNIVNEQSIQNDNLPNVGKGKAPNFKLTAISGEEYELDELKGNGVLVNFWASWCQPCRNEMPLIQKVYDDYKGNGLTVLAVNIGETKDTVINFMEDNPALEFPVLLENKTTREKYLIDGLPVTYFINSNGVVEARYSGEMNEEQLHVFIDEILP